MRRGQFFNLFKQVFSLAFIFAIILSYQNCRKTSSFSSQWSGPSLVEGGPTPIIDAFAKTPECAQVDGKYIVPYNSNTAGTNHYKIEQGSCRLNANAAEVGITFTVPKMDNKDIYGNFSINVTQKSGYGREQCEIQGFDSQSKGGTLHSFNRVIEERPDVLSGVSTVNFGSERPIDFGPGQTVEQFLNLGVRDTGVTIRGNQNPILYLNPNLACKFTDTLISVTFEKADYLTVSAGVPQQGPENLTGYSPTVCESVESYKLNVPLFSTPNFGGSLDNKPCKIEPAVADSKNVKFKVSVGASYRILYYLPGDKCDQTATCQLGLSVQGSLECGSAGSSKDLGVTRNVGGVNYKLRYLETLQNEDFDSGFCWDFENGLCPYECAKNILMIFLPKQ